MVKSIPLIAVAFILYVILQGLGPLVVPLDAGTYRLLVDEELIEGLLFPAYRRTATHLEIPAVGINIGTRQLLQVDLRDVEAAIKKDAERAQ